MILLEHIWKSYGRGRKAKDVLIDIDTALDFGAGNIGILGGRKSGKTTLLNVIAGVIPPDHGRVRRRIRVSWPLSWRGIGRGLTGDSKVAFLSRLYQADRRATLGYVAELSRLNRKLYSPLNTYTAREKDRLMLALAMALDFDLYLVDEALPAIQPELKDAYDAAWRECLRNRRVLVVSSKPAHLPVDCHTAAILDDGRLGALMTSAEAAASLRRTARSKRLSKVN